MQIARSIHAVRDAVAAARSAGKTIGLVPTMGALHDGHFSLIDAARAGCDYVVVSIFVNPLQFGPAEDLDAYPRREAEDLAGCEAWGVDAVFLPSAEELYPGECLTEVRVERLSRTLCGASRPGHFPGVCTVVAKLFNIVQPDRAYFGAKDFQQAAILRRMVTDLDFPVEIVVCPIVREPDGVAMSSRNAYLTPEQRRQARALHAALKEAEASVLSHRPSAREVVAAIRGFLASHAPDGAVDYVQIVDPSALSDVEQTDAAILIALAVTFGRARLIDNLLVDASRPDG